MVGMGGAALGVVLAEGMGGGGRVPPGPDFGFGAGG
jgi:hypothetical protein